MSKPSRHTGFSLIEALVVVAIVGTLSAIALPNYASWVMRARVAEATSSLASWRLRMEQYYQDNRNYGNTTCGIAAPPAANTFDYSCSLASAGQGYALFATGKGAANGFAYALDQDGNRATIAVPGNWGNASNACWILRKGETC